jgi:hypothetical protein
MYVFLGRFFQLLVCVEKIEELLLITYIRTI